MLTVVLCIPPALQLDNEALRKVCFVGHMGEHCLHMASRSDTGTEHYGTSRHSTADHSSDRAQHSRAQGPGKCTGTFVGEGGAGVDEAEQGPKGANGAAGEGGQKMEEEQALAGCMTLYQALPHSMIYRLVC